MAEILKIPEGLECLNVQLNILSIEKFVDEFARGLLGGVDLDEHADEGEFLHKLLVVFGVGVVEDLCEVGSD